MNINQELERGININKEQEFFSTPEMEEICLSNEDSSIGIEDFTIGFGHCSLICNIVIDFCWGYENPEPEVGINGGEYIECVNDVEVIITDSYDADDIYLPLTIDEKERIAREIENHLTTAI